MLAFGLAGFGAGRFDCRVDDLGVTLRGNFLLCNDDRVADRAVLALGLTGLGAGGLNCRVNDLGVSCCGNFLHAGESRAADRALRAGCVSGLGAGCGLLGNFNGSMTGSIDCFGFGFVADRAGVGLDTGIFAGRSGRDLALIPLVSRCGNFLHAGESLAADRAFFAGFMTSLGAGSGLLGDFNGSMTSSSDCFCFGFVANRAGVGLDTGIFTSRSGRDHALIPLVSLGRDDLLRNDDLVADGAVFTLGQASLRAGRSLCCIDYFCVAGRRDFFHTGENRITNGALRTGFMTSLGAGSGLLGNFNGSMTGSFDFSRLGLIAALTLASALFFALFRAGRGSRYSPFAPVMTKRETNLTVADLLIAVLAVGIAGISGLGASGVFRVADLGVLV